MLSESVRAEIKQWMDLYPPGRQRSAILPALYVIQREFGYCRVDAQNELAAMLDLEPAEVGAVVGFYNMFHEEPKGEYHIEVCTNVPCMLRGANQCMHPSWPADRRRQVCARPHGMFRFVRHGANGGSNRTKEWPDPLL